MTEANDRWLVRAPGTVDILAVSRDFGGEVEVTCGICGVQSREHVNPSGAHHRVPLIIERSLRKRGWVLHHVWGWVHEKYCLRIARREIRAGHQQLPLF